MSDTTVYSCACHATQGLTCLLCSACSENLMGIAVASAPGQQPSLRSGAYEAALLWERTGGRVPMYQVNHLEGFSLLPSLLHPPHMQTKRYSALS